MRSVMVLTLGWILCAASAEAKFYVSADAKSGGNGAECTPYQTLTQARDGIRLARKAGTLKSGEAVTVEIGPGVYRVDTTFELTAEDGGTAEAPVIYRAQKQGQSRIHGGMTLTAEMFKPLTDESVLSRLDPAVRKKVLVCDLSAAGEFKTFKDAYHGVPVGPWLYVNGQPMTLARWPNNGAPEAGWAGFTKAVDNGLPKANADDPALRKAHPGSFVFDDARPSRWNLAEGVWLLGYWTHDWCDEVIKIGSYDPTKKTITMAAPHSYGINGGTWGAAKRRFFALNLLEELDAPGEWYLDRNRKQLYFYPQGAIKGQLIVLGALSQPLVRASGTKHLTMAGLAFEYAHADGIVLQNAENVEIAGCIVANCAASGISVQGSNNTIRSCDLFNLGRGGISLNGGDRKSLTPARNLAVNNHIHHYGVFQRTYAPGIGVGGCGQIIRHNVIHDAPHNGVLYGGNEHLFELNEVHRVVMETGDAGAFYTGRDWTSQGNVLRHNYIHDLGGGDSKHVNTMGVYLDDCDCGDTMVGNVFYRAGRAIMIGGGRDNPVLNNLVIDCPIGLHVDSRGMSWKQWNNPSDSSWCLEKKAQQFNYTQIPWSQKYPHLATIMTDEPRQPLHNPIRRNVFVDCSKSVCSFDGNVKKLLNKFEISENLAVDSTGANAAARVQMKGFVNLSGSAGQPVDLGFADARKGNFTLRVNARLLAELPSFEKIPFDKIGLYKDQYRQELPTR